MAYSIHRHLAFNTWANTQLTELLLKTEDEIYFKENRSSFSSIAKTALHMWGAQDIWLRRLQGESLSSSPTAAFANNKMAMLNGLVQSSADIEKFIKTKDDAFLASMYSYKNLKGEPFTDPVEDTLFHVVNHSSYHRGQIITMLRESGITNVVSTDLIHYLRNHK